MKISKQVIEWTKLHVTSSTRRNDGITLEIDTPSGETLVLELAKDNAEFLRRSLTRAIDLRNA